MFIIDLILLNIPNIFKKYILHFVSWSKQNDPGRFDIEMLGQNKMDPIKIKENSKNSNCLYFSVTICRYRSLKLTDYQCLLRNSFSKRSDWSSRKLPTYAFKSFRHHRHACTHTHRFLYILFECTQTLTDFIYPNRTHADEHTDLYISYWNLHNHAHT